MKPSTLPHLQLKDLAELSPTELLQVLEIRNQPAIRRNMYSDHEISLDEHDRWARRMLASQDSKFFAPIQNEEIIGGVSLTNMHPVHKRADWAFYLSEACHGRGLGKALEYQFVSKVFRDFELEKLNCEVLSFNKRVIELHQKFGFKIEGIRRKHIIRNGERHDAVLLGITKDEWEEFRQERRSGWRSP